MRKIENDIAEQFYRRFNNLNIEFKTKKKVYSVKAVRPKASNIQYDLSIKIANKIIAMLEFKSNLTNIRNISSNMYKERLWTDDIPYFVFSDGEEFFVFDQNQKKQYSRLTFDQFISLLIEKEDIDLNESKRIITRIFREIIQNSKFEFLKERSIDNLIDFISEIEFDELSKVFYFIGHSDMNSFENHFFRSLLKDDKSLRKIYRYTNLGTIYSSLNHNSYRMNCIVGMNDISEVNYAENYVSGIEKNYEDAHWKTIENSNNRFISSFSLKKDDLTQWRLYADDSKGVCLVFDIDKEFIDTKFILKRVSYAKRYKGHIELDLVKEIISKLKIDYGIDFEFRTLNIWKHFFKPYEYAVEEEVRLLYIHHDDEYATKNWLLTSSHQILNPYVEFTLNDVRMPIKLKEIVLGPKCPEKLINKKQFEQYIRELRRDPKYNVDKVNVEISSIRNYR